MSFRDLQQLFSMRYSKFNDSVITWHENKGSKYIFCAALRGLALCSMFQALTLNRPGWPITMKFGSVIILRQNSTKKQQNI